MELHTKQVYIYTLYYHCNVSLQTNTHHTTTERADERLNVAFYCKERTQRTSANQTNYIDCNVCVIRNDAFCLTMIGKMINYKRDAKLFSDSMLKAPNLCVWEPNECEPLWGHSLQMCFSKEWKSNTTESAPRRVVCQDIKFVNPNAGWKRQNEKQHTNENVHKQTLDTNERLALFSLNYWTTSC